MMAVVVVVDFYLYYAYAASRACFVAGWCCAWLLSSSSGCYGTVGVHRPPPPRTDGGGKPQQKTRRTRAHRKHIGHRQRQCRWWAPAQRGARARSSTRRSPRTRENNQPAHERIRSFTHQTGTRLD